jgi:hypothetical protein
MSMSTSRRPNKGPSKGPLEPPRMSAAGQSPSALTRILSFALLVAAMSAACGGGLRRLPLTEGDGGPGGSAGGGAGRGGSTGTAGDGGVNTDAPTCMAGGACVPTNPCRKGQFVCMEGAMSCAETQDMQANGTECDVNMVCNNGTCTACEAGMACDVPGKPCRVGSIVCTTGAPVCTETDNKPNGMSCGTGMVCQAGACVACAAGASCEPTNRCHVGMLVCTGGTATCMDTGTNVTPGTTCGQDRVCNAGTCTDCTVGAACTVAGKPCRRGTTACNTGAPVCLEAGDQPNGTACGNNMVCASGMCMPCTAGPACTPTNPCHAGVTVCAPTIGCSDTGSNLANGTVCGTDRVCNAGACVTCVAGPCQPADVCKTGINSCATGSPVCNQSGNQPNGTNCGTNRVCMGGSCMMCSAGAACVPANPCHRGTLACDTGAAVCNDNGMSIPDGTMCGTNLVCRSGACVSCIAGQACQPTNPCKNGLTSCMTGVQTCMESGNKTPGTPCGAGQSCANGTLTLPAMCTAAGACAAAMMQCTSGACNPSGTDCSTCPVGQTSCPAGCRNLADDPLNCGQCGMVCPSPAPGTGIAYCSGGQCGFRCNSGYLECVSGSTNAVHCQRQYWDFEDQSLGGLRSLLSPSAIRDVAISARQAHEGRFSMALAINATGTGQTRGFQVGQIVCGGQGYVPAESLSVSGWMYLEPADDKQTIGKASRFGMRVWTENGDDLVPAEPRGYNEWFMMSTPIGPIGKQMTQFASEAFLAPEIILPVGNDWVGTIYIDDILIK